MHTINIMMLCTHFGKTFAPAVCSEKIAFIGHLIHTCIHTIYHEGFEAEMFCGKLYIYVDLCKQVDITISKNQALQILYLV